MEVGESGAYKITKVGFSFEVRVQGFRNDVEDLGLDAFIGGLGVRVALRIEHRNLRDGTLQPLEIDERFIEERKLPTKHLRNLNIAAWLALLGRSRRILPLGFLQFFVEVFELLDANAQGLECCILFFEIELILLD